MSISEEITELMKEGQAAEATSEFTIEDLIAELAVDKKPKIKPNAGFIPAPFEAQWVPTATILSVDVRTCQACGTVHSLPIGFFLESTHRCTFSDRKLTQIHASIHSMPDLYKNLPSRIEETHSIIGFCSECFGLAPSLSNPFYTHVPTILESYHEQEKAPGTVKLQVEAEVSPVPAPWDLLNDNNPSQDERGQA